MSRLRVGSRATECKHLDRPNWAHGFCSSCYQKYRRRENPEYRQKHREKNWESRIRCNFGITPEQYNEMLNRQKHRCKICGKPEKTKRLAIDHDWNTGEIRGLLCLQCNTHLGWYERQKRSIEDYLRVL